MEKSAGRRAFDGAVGGFAGGLRRRRFGAEGRGCRQTGGTQTRAHPCLLYTSYYKGLAEKIVYTGQIDAYFDDVFGPLAYRGLRFETKKMELENYQGVAVMNYTDRETPYTRSIEHKHFVFGTQPVTYVTWEYPQEWQPGQEPYYPVNDAENQALYGRYAALAAKEPNVIFGGRLARCV